MQNNLWLRTRTGILRHKSGLVFLVDKTTPNRAANVVLMSVAIYKAKSQANGHTEAQIQEFIESRTQEAVQLEKSEADH
jgi:hypothetical protein